MSPTRNRNRRFVALSLLFVLGGLALAIVGELVSSPLQQALRRLPLELAVAVAIVLLAIAVIATIAYERLARGGDVGADGPDRAPQASSPPRMWRPSRRTVTGLTAVVALAAVGLIGVTTGPRLFEWLTGSVTAAITPPWTSEPLHTFQRPVPTSPSDDPDQTGRPTAVFSPDGTKLAISGYTHTIQVWDLESARRTVLRVGKPPQHITFSPDGGTLALVGNPGGSGVDCGGEVELWDIRTQRLVAERQRPVTLYAVAFSPDGKRFALGGKECESLDGVVEVWNIARGERIQHLTHGTVVGSVAFGSDGDTLASAGNRWDSGVSYSSIRLWDAERGGKPEATLEHPANFPVDAFGLVPSGGLAVSAGTYWKSPSNGHSEDGSSELVTVWDTATAQAVTNAESEDRPIDTFALAPDGTTVAVARSSRQGDEPRVTVELLDARSLKKVESFEVASSSVHSMDFDDSGRRLAIATFDGAELWSRHGE